MAIFHQYFSNKLGQINFQKGAAFKLINLVLGEYHETLVGSFLALGIADYSAVHVFSAAVRALFFDPRDFDFIF